MHLASVERTLRWEQGSIPHGNLEALIIEHLDTQRELATMEPAQATLIRLLIWGYNQQEICHRLGLNPRTVARRLLRIKQEMLRS